MPTASIKVAKPIPSKRYGNVDWSLVDEIEYPVQSASITQSWGSEPSEANIVYLSANEIHVGSAVQITVGQYFFSGICKSDRPLTSSRGNNRQLTFQDYRRWLAMDKTYGVFNKRSDIMIDGQRRKRYEHILPWDHYKRHRSWTVQPYTMGRILELVLGGPGIETPWRMARLNRVTGEIESAPITAQTNIHRFHEGLGQPIYDLDFEKGKSLAQLMLDLCQASGLLFTLMPSPEADAQGKQPNLFRLVWAMKGVDGLDVDEDLESDQRESATELSGHPTRIRVLGDRNIYQVHDIDLVPDWNGNWSEFYTTDLLADYVYRYGIHHGLNNDPYNGLHYYALGETDPEHIIGRQLALSHALQVTVWEFNEEFKDITQPFKYLDNHRYQGKCRNDMPAALYIRDLLFRCFRLPDNFHFNNTYNDTVFTPSLDPAEKILAGVTYDPVSGETFYDPDDNQDGNAFVLVRGYQVGKDMFEKVRPDRFDLTAWNSTQNIWQKIDVQVQNNNDGQGPTIVFDEPVIKCENIVEMIDGFARIKARPTFAIPDVKAVLTFTAENFSWYQTLRYEDPSVPPEDEVNFTQVNDEVMQAPGIGGEFVVYHGNPPAEIWLGKRLWEIPYQDGKLCRTKAIEIANSVLRRQATHDAGSFEKLFHDSDAPIQLTGKIDRISIEHSTSGSKVRLYRTNERNRDRFEPERDFDRRRQWDTLLPNEADLRKSADFAYKVAAAARVSKDAYKLLNDAFNGSQPHAPTEKVQVKPGTVYV